MSFQPPGPGAAHAQQEAALAAPTGVLRRAAGLDGDDPMPGLAGCDLEAALAGVEHDFIESRDHGVHLEVHEAASGAATAPTIVIHHGLGDHVRRFTPLAGRLAEAGINTIAVDRPGHGLSEGHRGHCPLEWALEVVDDAAAYARKRFDGPLLTIGDSLGGITLWYALTCDLDADAVLCHCIGHPDVHHDPSMRWKGPLTKVFGAVAPKVPVPVRQIADYSSVALDPRTQAAFDDEVDEVFNFTVTAASVASYVGFEPGRPWAEVTTPVAVWIGAEDEMVTPEFTRRSYERETPPNATYAELPGQGHQVFLDHLSDSFPPLLEWARTAASA